MPFLTPKSSLFIAATIAAALGCTWRSRGQSTTEPRTGPAVVASLDRLDIAFPPDTSRAWPIHGSGGNGQYGWSMHVPDLPEPLVVSGIVWGIPGLLLDEWTTVPSLDSLTRLAWTRVCVVEWLSRECDDTPVSIALDRRTVRLSVSDASTIRRLLGMRPPAVMLSVWSRGERVSVDTVPVRYADPQIPPADSALHAYRDSVARERARRSRSVTRWIDGMREGLWLQMGDSVLLTARERTCTGHLCSGRGYPTSGRWWISDPEIASLRVVPPDTNPRSETYNRMTAWLTARSAGRGTVAAILEPYVGPPTRDPVPDAAVGNLVVIPRVGSVRIQVDRDSVVREDSLIVHVEVRDVQGRIIPRVPVALSWSRHGGAFRYEAGPSWLHFCGPVADTVHATFGGFHDSVIVRVLPRPTRRLGNC